MWNNKYKYKCQAQTPTLFKNTKRENIKIDYEIATRNTGKRGYIIYTKKKKPKTSFLPG